MKKAISIFLFLFLTGLFAGLFFCMNLSEANGSALSSLLIAGLTASSPGFFNVFLSAAVSNFTLALLMLPSLLTRLLCPLPPLALLCKSFAVGFCSGLVFLGAEKDAFFLSLLKLFPQNVFYIPAFLLLSAVLFYGSLTELCKKNRPSREKEGLKNAVLLSAALMLAGCITEAACHLIALSP